MIISGKLLTFPTNRDGVVSLLIMSCSVSSIEIFLDTKNPTTINILVPQLFNSYLFELLALEFFSAFLHISLQKYYALDTHLDTRS